MNRSHRTRGQSSILYAILLMPTLFIVVALTIDIATLQLERLRLDSALDLATVTAANAVDPTSYTRTGVLRLNPAAATAVTREYLIRNLSDMRDAVDPVQVAAEAEVIVVNEVPARDPYRGVLLDRPSVCARIHVTHHFVFLGWIGIGSADLTVTADAEIRT